MELSFSTSYRARSPPLLTSVLAAVAVALLVAARRTDAAPQADSFIQEILKIDGQLCQCLPFHLCSSEDEVKIPPGSSETGCLNTVCCRTNDGELVTSSTDSNTLMSSTSESPQCTCVQQNRCSEKSAGNGNCMNNNEVCCGNQYIDTENSNNSDDNSNSDVSSCGVARLPPPDSTDLNVRITANSRGVSQTYFGQFPWMVVILKTVEDRTGIKTENVFQCGGSLIHPRVVLTAAHCVRDININVIKARIGEWDTQSASNSYEKYQHQDIAISRVFVHPNHDNGSMFNDVALIELVSETILKPHINVICLPENEIKYNSLACVSTGWGKDGFGQQNRYQTILKKVDLPIVPNNECQKRLRSTRLGSHFELNESFICAGGEKGVDACLGDGGGPLVCAVNGGTSKLQKYVQVGIISWGIGCGEDLIPGVYSSVTFNSKWIKNKLREIVQ